MERSRAKNRRWWWILGASVSVVAAITVAVCTSRPRPEIRALIHDCRLIAERPTAGEPNLYEQGARLAKIHISSRSEPALLRKDYRALEAKRMQLERWLPLDKTESRLAELISGAQERILYAIASPGSSQAAETIVELITSTEHDAGRSEALYAALLGCGPVAIHAIDAFGKGRPLPYFLAEARRDILEIDAQKRR